MSTTLIIKINKDGDNEMYEIVEQFAWSNGEKTVALNQVFDRTGYEKVSQGFRIKKDGKTLFPSSRPFASYGAAEAAVKGLI
ncbi:hypothetical protein [uncultured Roseibium sp.]|uniref:hypothetical protein n=1 Tax=uncultured Roseibium sp. TaxID=1936171 RepID=UPI002639DA8E|nr:hypothetical protein [uncultured Roseibium sp.]